MYEKKVFQYNFSVQFSRSSTVLVLWKLIAAFLFAQKHDD